MLFALWGIVFHSSSERPLFIHSLYRYWLSIYCALGAVGEGLVFSPGLCSYGALVLCSGGKTVSKYTKKRTRSFQTDSAVKEIHTESRCSVATQEAVSKG